MVKCSNCGRENDDSFSFCLDCGSELKPGGAPAPGPATGTTPSQTAAPATGATPAAPATGAKPAAPATGAAPAAPATGAKPAAPATGAAPAAPPAASKPATPAAAAKPAAPATGAKPAVSDTIPCPSCGTPVGVTAAFCSSCGQKMGEEGGKGSTMFMHQVAPGAVDKPRARMVLIKPDGTEGTVFTIAAEKTTLGRSKGTIMFPKDQYVSPAHAEIQFGGGKLTIVDLNSLNGVYYKITKETRIFPGTYFRIGRQLLRLEVPGDFQDMKLDTPEGDDSDFWGSPPPQVWARLVQVLEGGKIGEIHLLTQGEVMIGREDGEIRFPEDGFISSRHCMLNNKDGDCYLRDLGSSNGTYLRIRENQELANNDRVQIGNQVLKVDMS
jgi:pSer/pThr/pTyr-binding forkhead associated (FHA) protein